MWNHIIIEGYCSYDFKRKADWTGNKRKEKPLKGCKKYPTAACLGEAAKCPFFFYSDVDPWERNTMMLAWAHESGRRAK